ncbi:hypothetical protein B8W95_13645, partial [Staphylococcus pasteuri]
KSSDQDTEDVVRRELVEHKHPAAREEGVVEPKARVLGRGGDQGQRARFDDRQEGVLLTLVESLDLVDEEEGLATSD